MDETGAQMLLATSRTTMHQPDREHGRPEKDNFGDTVKEGEDQGQKGFSRQC
ncbi:hypothetical protein K435DRAFT_379922 [Dendrothele bispora CBS 962.96]|uniref:Uncharacterized protein n=1 Tax=Dendrothele bispora (strain CBS 962.96) TaxID=1314807 RepID=A0A4S8MV87_DENBC|nr:hypothetical protein K435DRAFT_379922 [Dendrothele bispora CBS 962.96]